ncbi:sulfotransferase family 2 domain-containing protein [Shinella sp. G-2]|uniref:sulfotransferase family 2 domain-containing protein n=1 Tax=Shinella sp. G-2 TaxID=3133141 RepID=UPI003D06884B
MPFIEVPFGRVLFIHIPKTGGTSIEGWMSSLATLRLKAAGFPAVAKTTPQHFRMHDIRFMLGEGFFDYTFTFSRDPYSRIESEYRMRAHLGKQGFWGQYPTFSNWLEDMLTRAKHDSFFLDNHLRPQWEFIGSGVEVFKFEDGLLYGISKVAEKIGVEVPGEIPHELPVKKDLYPVEWDLSDRLKVQEFYRKDFEIFGYDL